jgi:hypothetical protein
MEEGHTIFNGVADRKFVDIHVQFLAKSRSQLIRQCTSGTDR